MVNIINCNIDDLYELSKSKRIYGYGVSKKLQTYSLYRVSTFSLSEIIYKLVDSDPNKCNCKYVFPNGEEKDVIDFDDFEREIDPKEDVILIISMRYGEIIERLDSVNKLDGTTCLILNFIDDYYDSTVDMKSYYGLLSKDEKIPKVIHYCWFGNNELPDQYKEYIATWKKYCPDYEIIQWNEKNYDVYAHSYTKWAYENEKWPFVSDYARIDVLYRFGGIYLDTDVELIKNMDELRRFSAFMGFETTQMINSGLGMGAQKGNPILRDFLSEYDSYSIHEGEFDMIPCTVHQSAVLDKYGLVRNNTFQVLDHGNMVILPTEFLCGIRMYTQVRQITHNTFSLHHYSGNWGGEGIKQESDRLREKYAGKILKRVQPRLEI